MPISDVDITMVPSHSMGQGDQLLRGAALNAVIIAENAVKTR